MCLVRTETNDESQGNDGHCRQDDNFTIFVIKIDGEAWGREGGVKGVVEAVAA